MPVIPLLVVVAMAFFPRLFWKSSRFEADEHRDHDKMSSSMSGSSSPAVVRNKPRRQAITRACDRCRHRKAKCDFDDVSGTCSHCGGNNVGCTFDMPLGKRGPKSRKRPNSSIPPEAVSTFPGCRTIPPSVPTFVRNATPGTGSATFGSPSNSSTTTSWEPPPAQLELGVGTAAAAAVAGPSPGSTRDLAVLSPVAAPGLSAIRRWHNLARALTLQNKVIDQVVEQCFSLFFQYLYPLTPLVHEPSLLETFAAFASRPPIGAITERITDALPALNPAAWAAGSSEVHSPVTGGEASRCLQEAAFTLITAVCAEAAFMLPKDLFPEGETVADLFLQASRDCLNSYLEEDLENPNANSVTIRYFHSNCVHAAGKPKYSWHIFGEATRLVHLMRLYDESSLEGLPPIEAEMRRRAFWIVYMGDKSAAILNNRPITMHKYSFEAGITTAYPTGAEDGYSPMGTRSDVSMPPRSHRGSFIAGFNANLRLWQAASDLIIQMRLFQDQKSMDLGTADGTPGTLLGESERRRLDSLYVHFITCMDDLPPFLHTYTCTAADNGDTPLSEASQYVIQCANLQVSFHCLRMVITQKFEDIAPPGTEQADLRKTEIVRDTLRVMHEAPFWALQVNGEPHVEKIRLIGATLLSIIHRNETSPLGARARADFSVLLDILTRLNSKASDALKSTSDWAMYN